jgi:5-methylcytosine-specific restriction endonuclease McrA
VATALTGWHAPYMAEDCKIYVPSWIGPPWGSGGSPPRHVRETEGPVIGTLLQTPASSTLDELPSVVSLKTYVKPSTHPAFTRFNVFLRDRFSCQYCGSHDDLTFDHLLPRSRGGHTTWSNVVAACSPCNLRKGNLTPKESGMYPAQMPFQPTVYHLHRNGRLFPPNYLHDSWLDYLYWDSELEP